MATELAIFPQLITELRLEIWRLAMPDPFSTPLYPYRKGCWEVEDLGLELRPDGKDLRFKFNTSLLEPLRIQLPLYAVNREARDVALKYVHEHNLIASTSNTQRGFEFLRHFDRSTDIMFLPTADIGRFLVEQVQRLSEPDIEHHHYSVDYPLLQRLAITAAGLEHLKHELEYVYDISGPVAELYVIDVASDSTHTLAGLEKASKYTSLDLEDACRAQLSWRSSTRQWKATGDDTVFAYMRQLVAGLDDPASSTSEFDLEVHLVHINTSGLDLSPDRRLLSVPP